MSYATNLREAMVSRSMNQGQLARAAGVSPSQVSAYLGGHSEPRQDAAKRIAAALGLQLEDLYDKAPADRDCSDRNVPVAEAAHMLGIAPESLRAALQERVVDFGFAVKGSGDQYVYHISPKKLFEYIGTPQAK